MALLLGALILHGVTPGPLLLTKNPDIFWGVVASMYLGNAMLLVLNLPLIGLWVQLLRIPYPYLMPAIVLFCIVGSYSVANGITDVYLRTVARMNENTTREAEADPHRRAMAWTNKGLTLVRQQRFQDALGCFEEALVLFKQGDEPMRIAEQWGNIGSVYRDLEQPDRALENYQQALAIYRELGYTERIADQCTNIAYTCFMQQDQADALRWYREALALYTAAGSEPKRRFTTENVERLEAVLGES